MGSIDAVVLAMLAVVVLAVLVHLRMVRSQASRKERIMRCLVIAVQRENAENPAPLEELVQAS